MKNKGYIKKNNDTSIHFEELIINQKTYLQIKNQ